MATVRDLIVTAQQALTDAELTEFHGRLDREIPGVDLGDVR